MDEIVVYLTKEQALDCLDVYRENAVDERETVHCFLSASAILMGADWELSSVKETIEKAKPEWIMIPGKGAKSMKHAVAVYCEKVKDWCFFASDMDKIEAIESEARA